MSETRVRLLSDLGKGDTVRTGSGRLAVVKGFEGEAVVVQFLLDSEEATLLPHLLTLVGRAKPHAFPKSFFGGGVAKAMAQ